jgi:hypothetical protein
MKLLQYYDFFFNLNEAQPFDESHTHLKLPCFYRSTDPAVPVAYGLGRCTYILLLRVYHHYVGPIPSRPSLGHEKIDFFLNYSTFVCI